MQLCCLPLTSLLTHAYTLASYPGSLWRGGGEEKEPGTHCSRMRVITPTFRGSGYFPCTSVLCNVTSGCVRSKRVMQAQLAAKRAVVAVTWTPARVRDLTAMEHSIPYTLQKVGRPRITLKSEQREYINHMYEGKDVIVWLPTGFGKCRMREQALSPSPRNEPGYEASIHTCTHYAVNLCILGTSVLSIIQRLPFSSDVETYGEYIGRG